MLAFAEQLTLAPASVGPETQEAMRRAGLDEDKIFAAVQAICYRNFISRSADMLGVEREQPSFLDDVFVGVVAERSAQQAENDQSRTLNATATDQSRQAAASLNDKTPRSYTQVLHARPAVAKADAAVWQAIRASLSSRRYSLLSVCIAGLLGLNEHVAAVRGDLGPDTAERVASYWPGVTLDPQERALLNYVQLGTVAEATIDQSDVADLQKIGIPGRDILAVAALTSYQNYALRAARAFAAIAR